MPKPKALEQCGLLLFLAILSVLVALIGLIKGITWGSVHSSYIFLILAVIFFLWGFEKAR
jgi:hypothetical protein